MPMIGPLNLHKFQSVTASADMHIMTLNLGAHMYARKDFADVFWTIGCAQTSVKQQEQGALRIMPFFSWPPEALLNFGSKAAANQFLSEQQLNDCSCTPTLCPMQ